MSNAASVSRCSITLLTVVLGGCKLSDVPSPSANGSCWFDCGFSGPYTVPPTPSSAVPTLVAGGLTFRTVSVGYDHVCGITTNGTAYCWGAIGHQDVAFHEAKLPEIVPGGLKFKTISAGHGTTCGITEDGRAMCWGLNGSGQLGIGRIGGYEAAPVPVDTPIPLADIATGGWEVAFAPGRPGSSEFACGRTAAGAVYCWGSNNRGQLGIPYAATAQSGLPVLVSESRLFAALGGTGYATPCALTGNGEAYCWGDNSFGELGIGTVGGGDFPPTHVAADLTFTVLSTGYGTCGLATTGSTHCWSIGSAAERGKPTLVFSQRFVAIAAGDGHACALTAGGAAYCWGSNSLGQLGTAAGPGLSSDSVATDLRFVQIAAGNAETCGITHAGEAYCWGSNEFGKLGAGK